MTEDHAIFVGGKPFMNYVTAVVMQFTTKGANQVVVRSRGKFISRAVDVAEVVKSRFLRDQIEVGEIKMDSEEFKNKEGRIVRVSTLDINLSRITKEAKPAEPAPADKSEPSLAISLDKPKEEIATEVEAVSEEAAEVEEAEETEESAEE